MTIWDILGIEPTTDENEIRRAYARQLKHRKPDQDPQGFQQLREAFDSAKRYANGMQEQDMLPVVDVSFDDQSATSTMDYVHRIMAEHALAPKASWQCEELQHQATEIAGLLVRNELEGLSRLHYFLDNEIPDALEARQLFSLTLAETLGKQYGLNRSVVHEVSAVMGWEVDNYRSSQLSPWLLDALDEQITITEQENYWQFLARQYEGSRLGQLKWRLLTEKGTQLPWWTRLIPDFVFQLNIQITELRKQFPGLIVRLNPELLNTLSNPTLSFSWGILIAIFFWSYTAWLPGQESPQMALQSLGLLAVVIGYLLVYPVLERRYLPESQAHKVLQTVLWLISTSIISFALYQVGRWLGGIDILFLAFLIVPVSWFLWLTHSQWRSLPIGIVFTTIAFPVLFIRRLPPMINLLALLLLPMLYAFLIRMIYFVD